jgi:regulator of protease activity HflC (stomatin/prohibitin superfamily)
MKIALLAALLFTAGCQTHVDAGHIGIIVDSCSGAGVEVQIAEVGYHTTGPCTSIIEYPTFVQTAVWTKSVDEGHPVNEEITFTNADQMQVGVDISLAYQLDPQKAPAFYKKFRADKIDTWTHGFLRNLARDKFDNIGGRYKIENIMGDNAAFLTEVRAALQKELDPYGVTLNQFGFIGAPRPPQSVINSINAKAEASQKTLQIELELKSSQAEARKHVAQAQAIRLKADAQSYANQKLASSLSPTLVDYKRIEKWDGHMPQVQGGGASMIQLK